MARLLAAELFLLLAVGAANAQTPPIFWMRTYAIPEHGHSWSVGLAVKDGGAARKKILALLEKAGGKPTQALESFPADKDFKHQQLVYSLPKAGAERALVQLKKLGKVRRLVQKDETAQIFTDDARVKLEALGKEREAGRPMLAQLPTTRAVVDEIVAHLEAARAGQARAAGRVLLDLAVDEAAN